MKRFAGQYIITNTGPILKRPVVTTTDDGTIISIESNDGDLREGHSTEFHNGILIPGFVNCHCHLELSNMKGYIGMHTGLGSFIEQIRSKRDIKSEITDPALSADRLMSKEGIVLCADVCNTDSTFNLKKESDISYINLLEVFGIDPEKAQKRMSELTILAGKSRLLELPFDPVPHSAYSMSLSLLRLLKNESLDNSVTSIHFMETEGEEAFLKTHSGPLMESYRRSGLLPSVLETVKNHEEIILNEITQSGNLILVHNTFVNRGIIKKLMKRENLFWCVCPNSNIYIENKIPPIDLLIDQSCTLVIGTDSLASNRTLSIVGELKTIQSYYPQIQLEELISWATINGARALVKDDQFGSISTGKKPGLLVLQNVDLQNMKLLPDSFVTRLI